MNPLLSLIFAAIPLNAPPEAPDPKLMELVRQLGHKSYKVRETAARELVKSGPPAVPALNAGMTDADLEVAERCRQLLPVAAAAERDEKLARFLKDPAAPPPKGLAGAEKFLAIAGDDKATRQIYAEMLAVHYAIIEGLEADPKRASRLMADFTAEAYDRWMQESRAGRYSYDKMLADRGQVALFLFVRADARFNDDPQNVNRAAMMLYGTTLKKSVSGPEAIPGVKKLFLNWLEKEKQSQILSQAFQIVVDAKMKEALPVALRIVKDKSQVSYSRAQVMLALLKLGDKSNLKDIEPLLADKSDLGTINFGNGQPLSVQMRDVALGVSVHLAGEKTADFGFDTTRFGGGLANSYYYYGFPDAAARDAAHAKWKALAAEKAKK